MTHEGNHGVDPQNDRGKDDKGHKDKGNQGDHPPVRPTVPAPSHAVGPNELFPRR